MSPRGWIYRDGEISRTEEHRFGILERYKLVSGKQKLYFCIIKPGILFVALFKPEGKKGGINPTEGQYYININFTVDIFILYLAFLSVCLSVLIYPKNVVKRGTYRAQILCGSSHDPRKGLWMLKITKICVQKLMIFDRF